MKVTFNFIHHICKLSTFWVFFPSFSCFGPVCIYRPKQPDFASTVGIFSGTKQRGYLYWFVGRYSIYRSYRPARYKINFLGIDNSTGKWVHVLLYINKYSVVVVDVTSIFKCNCNMW